VGAIGPIPKKNFRFSAAENVQKGAHNAFFDSIAPTPIEAPPLTKILDPPLLGK
jgi:hypothetical protein